MKHNIFHWKHQPDYGNKKMLKTNNKPANNPVTDNNS